MKSPRAPGGGRKGKPTALKIAGGNKYAARPEEPKFHGETSRPSWLSAKAALVFDELVSDLQAVSGLVQPVDAEFLGNLAEDLATLREARMQRAKVGLLAVKDGKIVANPLDAIIDRLWPRCASGLREFGMTPSARARLAVTPSTEKEWHQLMAV